MVNVTREAAPRPYVIGIAGPSGSGKTTLAAALARVLPATVYSLDDYYRDLSHLSPEERARSNFDDPESIESPLLTEHLAALSLAKEIERPVYDFSTHSRTAKVERIRSKPYLLVEGLWTLYWPGIRALMTTRVFVDTAEGFCFGRRLQRDVRERGRTPDSVHRQYHETVRPMGEKFVAPTRQFANVIVCGTDTLESCVEAVLQHVRAHSPSPAQK